jgi:hypothetical protein
MASTFSEASDSCQVVPSCNYRDGSILRMRANTYSSKGTLLGGRALRTKQVHVTQPHAKKEKAVFAAYSCLERLFCYEQWSPATVKHHGHVSAPSKSACRVNIQRTQRESHSTQLRMSVSATLLSGLFCTHTCLYLDAFSLSAEQRCSTGHK